MNPTHLAAVQAAARRLVATYGEVVTVRRQDQVVGPSDGSTLRAVRGRVAAPMEQGTTSYSADKADWLFLPSSLTLDGESVTLEMGDVIEAGTLVFDCVAPPGEAASRYTDQTQALLRVHTVAR